MKIKKYDSVNGWVQKYPEVTVGAIVVSNPGSNSSANFLRGDGQWASVDSGNQFVNISGDTMTGSLSIQTTTTGDTLLLKTTENSSTAAPVMTFMRDSLTPADGDYLGQLKFKAKNDANQETVMARITAKISDASDGTEDGLLEFANRKAGSSTITARLTSTDLKLINGTGLQVDGNVGIGTTNPDEKLHIEGNILVDAYNNNPGDSGIFFREGYTANQPSGATQPYNVSITLYDGSNAGASYDGLAINGNDGVAIRTNNDSSPKFLVKKDGNVGIGTTSPNNFGFLEKAFHINAGSSSDTTLKQAGLIISGSSDADDADDFAYLSFLNNHSTLSNDRVAELRIVKNGTNVNTADMKFYTANGTSLAARMTLTNDGKLGIGTELPGSTLEVVGDIQANRMYDRSNTSYYVDPASTSILYNIDVQNTTTTRGDLILDANNNAEKLYISRYGSTSSEFTSISRGDLITEFHTKNDEETSTIRFKFENTDTETGGGADANNRNIDLISDANNARILIDGNKVATESYVTTQINALVGAAPGVLDTLEELATSLNNDASFSTTMTNALAGKLNLTGGTLTGTLTTRAINTSNYNITGVGALQFNDPGPNEGISWNGGNFSIYESPDNLTTNSAGNLQFVSGGSRRLTVKTNGTVDVPGTLTAGAATIGGHTALHRDNRDDTYEFHDASDLAVGWYTIATNSGSRAIAKFGLRDTDSSRHQSVIFYAAHHYGNDDSNTITVLHNSRFGTSPFRYIRIKEGGTYDGAALQIYIDNAQNNVRALKLGDNFQSSGWVLKDWVGDAIDPQDVSNYSSFTEKGKIDLDQIDQGGIATTGDIYAGGNTTQYKVLTTNDSVNADTLDSINSTQFLRSDADDNYNGILSLGSTSTIKLPNSAQYGIRTSTGHRVIDSVDATLRIGDTGKHSLITLHGQDGDDFRVYYGATHYNIWHEGNDGTLFNTYRKDTIDSASEDFNDFTTSGTYAVNNWSQSGDVVANGPTNTSAGNAYPWGMLRVTNFQSSTGTGDGYIVQEYIPHAGDVMFMRFQWNGSWTSWRNYWGNENDGSGSNLDADKVDGLQASQFLRSDASDTMTGSLTLSSASYIEMRVNQTDSGYIRAGVSSGTAEGFIDSTGNGSYAGQGKIKFLTEGSEKARIDTNGNVGIGTTSPSYKLDVAGDVNVTGNFKVNGTNLSTGGGGVTSIKNFSGPYVNTNGFTAKQLPLSKTLSTGDRIGLSVIVGTTSNYGTRTQQTVWLEVGTSSHGLLFAYYDNSTSTMRLYSAEVYISSGNLYIDDAVAWSDGAFGHSGSSTSAIYVMDVLEYA